LVMGPGDPLAFASCSPREGMTMNARVCVIEGVSFNAETPRRAEEENGSASGCFRRVGEWHKPRQCWEKGQGV